MGMIVMVFGGLMMVSGFFMAIMSGDYIFGVSLFGAGFSVLIAGGILDTLQDILKELRSKKEGEKAP